MYIIHYQDANKELNLATNIRLKLCMQNNNKNHSQGWVINKKNSTNTPAVSHQLHSILQHFAIKINGPLELIPTFSLLTMVAFPLLILNYE